jgi:hypothetical protein
MNATKLLLQLANLSQGRMLKACVSNESFDAVFGHAIGGLLGCATTIESASREFRFARLRLGEQSALIFFMLV